MGLSCAKRILLGCGCVLLAALFGLCLFLPLPRTQSGVAAEIYTCVWENGSVTEESYSSVQESYVKISQNGGILLVREGISGEIAPSDGFTRAYRTLSAGDLAEMFAHDYDLDRLERYVLYRTFVNTLWYDGEPFAFTGDRIAHTKLHGAESLVLLRGGIAASSLQAANIKILHLRPQAEITGKTLVGTQVEEVIADAPYRVRNGAITLDTVGGKRLIAGMPFAKSVAVEDVFFADEGALVACGMLEELDLPFLGSSRTSHTSYECELAFLFSASGGEYRVPASLKRLKVRGGMVETNAFYRCNGLQNIDLCGVNAENIAMDAFQALPDLQFLHTPQADVLLAGNFTKTKAPCGCTVLERAP